MTRNLINSSGISLSCGDREERVSACARSAVILDIYDMIGGYGRRTKTLRPAHSNSIHFHAPEYTLRTSAVLHTGLPLGALMSISLVSSLGISVIERPRAPGDLDMFLPAKRHAHMYCILYIACTRLGSNLLARIHDVIYFAVVFIFP